MNQKKCQFLKLKFYFLIERTKIGTPIYFWSFWISKKLSEQANQVHQVHQVRQA